MQKRTVKILLAVILAGATLGGFASDPELFLWKTSELNTADNKEYLSSFEKEVILEINKLRSNPVKYAIDYIEPLKNKYDGRKFYYPGDLPLMTEEGVGAIIECINYLKYQKPVGIVYPSQGLSQAAKILVDDQSRSGGIGHKASDQSGFRQRIERYGNWGVRIAENIAYGHISPQQIVIYLLIDDGIKTRGHRLNFLNEDFKIVGVATGSHPHYDNMCVIEFAGEFQNIAFK